MFYIEKSDKPNFIKRKLTLLKVMDNTIMLPLLENVNQKQIEKMAIKTKKIIEKYSNSKKVVLSKEIKKEQIYINYLNTFGIEISDGKWLFEILLLDIIEYIIEKRKLKKANISILINDLTDIELYNIEKLAIKYKTINIVTNNAEKFRKLEKRLDENDGIILTVTNNKKKSLKKSQIIINVDFPKELLNKYTINEEAILVNIRGKIKIKNKRFNGLNINNYEIDYREDKKENKALSGKYYLKDLYESELYKRQKISQIREKLKLDKVIIEKLILNNGELQ